MKWDVDLINGLTEKIIGCSFKVLNTLGTGFLERVCQNALARYQAVRASELLNLTRPGSFLFV
jgi:hypothetical protein